MSREYRRIENSHIVVYTDYTGNAVTKNGMEICEDKMMLHRTGAFEGDMLFDLLTDTFVQYGACPVQNGFMMHTEKLDVSESADGLDISIKYKLYDDSESDDISCEQEIRVMIIEN